MSSNVWGVVSSVSNAHQQGVAARFIAPMSVVSVLERDESRNYEKKNHTQLWVYIPKGETGLPVIVDWVPFRAFQFWERAGLQRAGQPC